MWNTRACKFPTNLHGQLVRLYREVMLEHDPSWLGIQFILGSSYTAICATATWPCMSKPSRSKRRRRATWAKTGCWSKPPNVRRSSFTQPATATCRPIRPSGHFLHFFANLRQFSTAPILQSVLLLNQKFRTQWKAVHSVSETAGCGALCSGSSPGFQGCSSVRLVYHSGPRPNQKPAPSQTERAAARSSTSPWKS